MFDVFRRLSRRETAAIVVVTTLIMAGVLGLLYAAGLAVLLIV